MEKAAALIRLILLTPLTVDGYEAEEVVGKAKFSILRVPEGAKALLSAEGPDMSAVRIREEAWNGSRL